MPELTKEDFDKMVPFSQLPQEYQKMWMEMKQGDVTIVPGEEKVQVRVSRLVVERFQELGSGWEGQVDKALREWLDGHPAS